MRKLVALTLALVSVATFTAAANAETINGTFKYLDREGAVQTLRPIAYAKVEIHRCSGLFCAWGWAATTTTDANGSISVAFAPHPGATYAVKVFAENYGAVVWPKDVAHLYPYHQEPGQPDGAPINWTATTGNEALDFSYNFDDFWAAAHYNIAETVRRASDFVRFKRDPNEHDVLPPASVQPNSYPPWLGGGTWYDAPFDSVNIADTAVFDDPVILHEYAHFVEDQISSIFPMPSSHNGCAATIGPAGVNSAEHAWMEAFANWFSARVRTLNPGIFGGSSSGTSSVGVLETPPACTSSFPGDAIEDFVGGVLWDVTDSGSAEAFDTLSGFDTELMQIFDRELDTPLPVFPNITLFREAWLARGLPASALGRIFTGNAVPFNILHAPIARAGADQTVNEGATVTLDGGASEDPEAGALVFVWAQTGGPAAFSSPAAGATITFTAPQVGPGGAALTFDLGVTDPTGTAAVDSVTVTVNDLPPSPSVAPSLLDFGLQKVGTQTTKTAVLANNGPGALSLGTVFADNTEFAASSNCGNTLAAGATCTVTVTYKATTAGAYTANLVIPTTNANVASVKAALKGSAGIATAAIDKSSIAFSPTPIGTQVSDIVRLSNTGTVPVSVSSIAVLGTNQFSATSCPSSIPAGGWCDITVTFAPSAASAVATLAIYDDGGGPHSVTLTGTGLPVGVPIVNPKTLSFGSQQVRTHGQTLQLGVGNVGGASLTVTWVAIPLGHVRDFDVVGTDCIGKTLATTVAGCTISVAFAPLATGPRAAKLSIVTSAGNLEVPLSGTGTPGKTGSSAWYQFGRLAAHGAFAADEWQIDTANVATLAPAWSTKNADAVRSSPAIADDVVYWGSDDDTLTAWSLAKGGPLWTAALGGDVRSSPATDGTVVVVGCDDGTITAFEAATGAQAWSFATKAPVSSSPALDGGNVYVSTADGRLLALDATTGKMLWELPLGAPSFSSPAVAGGMVYVGSDNNRLRGVEAATGHVLWTAFANGPIHSSSPSVYDGKVLVASDAGRLYAFDAGSGTQLWTINAGGPIASSPAAADGVVYVGADDGNVYAVDTAGGNVLWFAATGAPVQTSPAVANGVVYAGNQKGDALAFDAWTGAQLWAHRLPGSTSASPAIANGLLVVAAEDGTVEGLTP